MYLFSKGKQEKENRSLPQVHQNEEPSAKTRAFNSPDKLVLIGIPKPTARTPRRQESSYTWSMILSFLENLPKTRFDATRQPWWARCAMWLRAKMRRSCVGKAQRPDGADMSGPCTPRNVRPRPSFLCQAAMLNLPHTCSDRPPVLTERKARQRLRRQGATLGIIN